MNTVFIGHPGPYGDIIVCAPIAKEYADQGFEVYWPVRVEYLDLVSRFDYVTPIPLPEIKLVNQFGDREDKNMSDMLMGQSICSQMLGTYLHVGDRFVDGKTPYATPLLHGETHEEKKYRISNVDFSNKYNLIWTRDPRKENELYDMVVGKKPYIFAHIYGSQGDRGKVPSEETLPIVEASVISGYNILDWFKVIQNAERIYCTESSFQAFVDGASRFISAERFILPMHKGKHTTNHKTSEKYWNKKYLA